MFKYEHVQCVCHDANHMEESHWPMFVLTDLHVSSPAVPGGGGGEETCSVFNFLLQTSEWFRTHRTFFLHSLEDRSKFHCVAESWTCRLMHEHVCTVNTNLQIHLSITTLSRGKQLACTV